jgi:hypothetical protein
MIEGEMSITDGYNTFEVTTKVYSVTVSSEGDVQEIKWYANIPKGLFSVGSEDNPWNFELRIEKLKDLFEVNKDANNGS